MKGLAVFMLVVVVIENEVGMVTAQTFDPLLNVESCTKSRLVVSTYGASTDGVIYIQGQGQTCQQTTSDGLALYEFDFQDCRIEWAMLFKIVIQKKSSFQTGDDKQIPIFCIADKSDLITSNTKQTDDKKDDESYNITVKPSAMMTFYKVLSNEEVSGREVKLTDTLIMALQLGTDFTTDFDIKARYCVASDIVIIDDFCATDTDLFPNFSKIKNGYLISEFGAFRTTSLQGGQVDMNFTCILQVCKTTCEPSDCNSNDGWGRKRRDVNVTVTHTSNANVRATGDITTDRRSKESNRVNSRRPADSRDNHVVTKRQTDGDYDIDVGARVKIVEKYSDIQIVTTETLCLNIAIFIVTIIFLGAGFLGFASSSVILYRKLVSAQRNVKDISEMARNNQIQHLHHKKSPSAVQRFDNPFNTEY